jgi:zinc protease
MVKIITLLVSLYVAQVWAMEGVSQATLKNGLKIIVKTDNRAPVFISQLWYKVGASNDAPQSPLAFLFQTHR